MSNANPVPEVANGHDDRLIGYLSDEHFWPLLRDGFLRLRRSDGFSHARALAFQIVLALIPAVIVLVAAISALNYDWLTDRFVGTVDQIAPGPAGDILRTAFQHADAQGDRGDGLTVIVLGGIALAIAGVTGVGQLQRAANRLYGIERDRPSVQKYTHAAVLAATAGILMSAAMLLLAFGDAITASLQADNAWTDGWRWGHIPAGFALAVVAITVFFKFAPKRRQPKMRWLAIGATVGVLLWAGATWALSQYLETTTGFGDTYGPLAGFIGLLLWAYLAAIAVLYGLAVNAQLEAIRAGREEPVRERAEAGDILVGV